MSRVVVDLDRLAEFAERLAQVDRHLARTRAEVDARVRALPWRGAAAATQAQAWAQWDAGAGEAHAALLALRAFAVTAHANYSAARLANRHMWSP